MGVVCSKSRKSRRRHSPFIQTDPIKSPARAYRCDLNSSDTQRIYGLFRVKRTDSGIASDNKTVQDVDKYECLDRDAISHILASSNLENQRDDCITFGSTPSSRFRGEFDNVHDDSLASLDIRIVKFNVGIEAGNIVVDESSSSVLKYKTPHFRASATVEVPPLPSHRKLIVGWIQVCTSLRLVNVYGDDGLTSWELPGLVAGELEMVSDSDGRRYPWYGSKREVQSVSGPSSQPTSVCVRMNDNFNPHVTWYIPHPDHSRQPKLTRVFRRQDFVTCLVVRDPQLAHLDLKDSGELSGGDPLRRPLSARVLRAVAWSIAVDIRVNPHLPRGQRSTVIGPRRQSTPKVVDERSQEKLLRCNAMKGPNANVSQVLVWRPRDGDPASVVVWPTDKSIDLADYAERTRDYYWELVENLTKDDSAELNT